MNESAPLQIIGDDPRVTSTMSGTVSGKLVDLLAPNWCDIDISDIAHGLSQLRRWSGQTRRPISVIEHSLLVARLTPSTYQLAALLHDAHEALFGDLPTPTARALDELAGGRVSWAIEEIKYRLDIAIARAALEAFAPDDLDVAPAGGLLEHARWIAADMRSEAVRAADHLALRYEAAVRQRDSLQHLDAFGETAVRNIPSYTPDGGELAAQWIAEVKGLIKARFVVPCR